MPYNAEFRQVFDHVKLYILEARNPASACKSRATRVSRVKKMRVLWTNSDLQVQ